MSATVEEDKEAVRAAGVCAASCGIAETDHIGLEADELHDKKLFTQPDSCCYGECPICFLPMPLDVKKSIFYSCCTKSICNGCDHAHDISNKQWSCPFCREPSPKKGENHKRIMKRIEANDPAAMVDRGLYLCEEGDFDGAFEYLTKAAELGDLRAHHKFGWMYERGEGVEKNEGKAVHHWEVAAIGGQPDARYNLGYIEERKGNMERAVKHFIIAAKLGDTGSMKELWAHYSDENITKDDLEATLRVHQAAIDAMKSPQRDAAEQITNGNKNEE
jgi:tetratricopeptide (TPR) repeat protein